MKRIVFHSILVILIALGGTSWAQDGPIPITAEAAFDAVQTQTDPISGESASVNLVDVRTRAEFFWVGAACQVDEIVTTKHGSIVPDYGKVILSKDGRFLTFEVDGKHKRLQTKKVSELKLSSIAINIPYRFWDEENWALEPNPDFQSEVEALATDGYDVVIFFCRSGGRSEGCLEDFDTALFEAIYEIDQPDGKSGRGGFEGSSYSDAYNGYRGFPERLTEIQEHPSVSWKDTGLPMKTSINPTNQ